MVRHQRIIVTSLPIQKAYEASLLYFKNLGFIEIEKIPNTYIKFQRGSAWLGDTWQTKKVYLMLQFSIAYDNKVAITCIYDISALQYIGKTDLENADKEIYGFRDYIAKIERELRQKRPKRICPKCKREIPWDAVICPYCGYKFPKLEKKGESSLVREKSQTE